MQKMIIGLSLVCFFAPIFTPTAEAFDVTKNFNFVSMKAARQKKECERLQRQALVACGSNFVDRDDPGYGQCVATVKAHNCSGGSAKKVRRGTRKGKATKKSGGLRRTATRRTVPSANPCQPDPCGTGATCSVKTTGQKKVALCKKLELQRIEVQVFVCPNGETKDKKEDCPAPTTAPPASNHICWDKSLAKDNNPNKCPPYSPTCDIRALEDDEAKKAIDRIVQETVKRLKTPEPPLEYVCLGGGRVKNPNNCPNLVSGISNVIRTSLSTTKVQADVPAWVYWVFFAFLIYFFGIRYATLEWGLSHRIEATEIETWGMRLKRLIWNALVFIFTGAKKISIDSSFAPPSSNPWQPRDPTVR